jgi:hypothetical protein
MGDGYKFCSQNMQHLFALMLNLFAVSANCRCDECVTSTVPIFSPFMSFFMDGMGVKTSVNLKKLH